MDCEALKASIQQKYWHYVNPVKHVWQLIKLNKNVKTVYRVKY